MPNRKEHPKPVAKHTPPIPEEQLHGHKATGPAPHENTHGMQHTARMDRMLPQGWRKRSSAT